MQLQRCRATKIYSRMSILTQTGREREAALLGEAATMLQCCITNWAGENQQKELSDALHFNHSLWNVFHMSLKNKECPLSTDLRRNLIALCVFVDDRIIDIMHEPLPQKLGSIISINLNVAEGLRISSDRR